MNSLSFAEQRMLAISKGVKIIDDKDRHLTYKIKCMGCGIRFGVHSSNLESTMRLHECKYDILDRFPDEFTSQNKPTGRIENKS